MLNPTRITTISQTRAEVSITTDPVAANCAIPSNVRWHNIAKKGHREQPDQGKGFRNSK